MTDKEIVKALECCIKVRSLGDCERSGCPAKRREGCSYYLRTDEDFEGVIFVELIKDALDLINRQQAEIERLEKDKENLAYSFANAVGRNLTVKEEAIKEFAERLRKKLIDGGLYPVFVKNKIAETEKEMVGGTE